MADNLAHSYNRRRVLTIDDLPDDDLLAIFDFYVVRHLGLDPRELNRSDITRKIESWQPLVHVCRRWRGLVFGSPRRLNVQICCTTRTPTRNFLDVWPALPLLIHGIVSETSVNNVIALLEYSDRICKIDFVFRSASRFEKLRRVMQVPFPELSFLYLSFRGSSFGSVLPDSFLGGSAPRLRYLYLRFASFPGLPKLLLSATRLVHLYLFDIPRSGYISPETMASCLSMLTSLETLQLGFDPYQTYPDLKRRRPFPPTRSVFPALTNFLLKRVDQYLEEFVARIDAPQLYRLSTTFFDDFKAPELDHFISRTPTLEPYDEAHLTFYPRKSLVGLRLSHPEPSAHRMVEVKISCRMSNRRLSTLARVCTSSMHLLLTMENLYIDGDVYSPVWRDDMENASAKTRFASEC